MFRLADKIATLTEKHGLNLEKTDEIMEKICNIRIITIGNNGNGLEEIKLMVWRKRR